MAGVVFAGRADLDLADEFVAEVRLAMLLGPSGLGVFLPALGRR
jgi:hypothetical protein